MRDGPIWTNINWQKFRVCLRVYPKLKYAWLHSKISLYLRLLGGAEYFYIYQKFMSVFVMNCFIAYSFNLFVIICFYTYVNLGNNIWRVLRL